MILLIVERNLVAHMGFEPMISSLRGTRPRPLDECAKINRIFRNAVNNYPLFIVIASRYEVIKIVPSLRKREG